MQGNEEKDGLTVEIPQETAVQEAEPEVRPPEPPKPQEPTGPTKPPEPAPVWKVLLFRCGVILLSTVLVCAAAAAVVKSTKNAYDAAKEEKIQAVYQAFYDKSFEVAEAEHHVANDVAISLTSVQTVDKLEVLRVSDVEYVILDEDDNKENVTSWLEVPGTGVFTVDLTLGEYKADSQRRWVHVRIPRPSLTEFTVDYANISQLLWNDDFFNGSSKAGEDLVRDQIRDGSLRLKEYMTTNRMIYESAADAAKRMVANLVRQFNPDIPDLTVEVEFIDEL